MLDRSNAQVNDSELRFSGEQGFFDRSPTVRFAIWLAFALSLFLFLHFREVRFEVLELGSIQPRYVVAQVDFEFVDREATQIAKQESIRSLGRIFRVVESEVNAMRGEFESALVTSDAERIKLADLSVEELYSVFDSAQKALASARFADPITVRRMTEVGMSLAHFQIYTPSQTSEPMQLSRIVWNRLMREVVLKKEFTPGALAFVFSLFEARKWTLEPDIPLEKELRTRLQDRVVEKVTKVSAGSRIIDQGEKVTQRHITMMQAMKKVLSERRRLSHIETLLGSSLLTLIITAICSAFVRINYPVLFQSNRKLCLLVTIIILSLGFAKGLEAFLLTSSSTFFDHLRYPLFVPFAAILTCNLMTASLATFVVGLLTVIFAMTLAFDYVGFMIMNLVASLIVILSTRSLRRRKEIFVVSFKAFLGALFVIISIHLYAGTLFSAAILYDALSAAFFMALTAVLALSLLPLLESAFHVMSDVSLMEYMDPNHDLMRRLSFEAPGTYQHTLMVCSLAEAAAVAIGANGVFCRVATLYHDIGKMVTPHFFTENQQGEMNVHQLLTPLESAQTIMAHVSEGVAMARKANLPEQFIDIIKQHHGTSLVYYFYRKQLDSVGGDPTLVDEAQFRYSGPKPRTKESAIIMIADIFEAASRSLDKIDEKILTELMDQLVREKMEDGQFDECLLTFEELSTLKKTMVQTLIAGMHSRIKYPRKR